MKLRSRSIADLTLILLLASCASPPPPPSGETAKAPEPAVAPGPSWSSAVQFTTACEATGKEVEAKRQALKASPDKSPSAVLGGYNAMLTSLDETYGLASLMANVHPEKEVRAAAEACERQLQKLVNELNMDRGLYDAISAVPRDGLDAETLRFIDKLLRDFRRAGVDKDEATRKELEGLHAEMVELGQTFSRNIRDDVRKVEVDKASLAGLPQDFIDAHPANEAGKVALTTNYPDFFPVETYADREELRKALYVEYAKRGYPANDEVLKKLLVARRRYAEILGHPTWASYMAEDKMVKTPEAIEKFIGEVAKIARPRMNKDLKVLTARKKKSSPKAPQIQAWDRFHFVEKVRAEKYGFEARAVRPYFEFGRVTAGILSLYGELFGLRFEKDPEAEVWHPSVIAYRMYSGDELVGKFYLDMHPREGKYGHAAAFPIHTGSKSGRVPVASLVCNFPDPAATNGLALMEHKDVITYFHEFGHLIHHLLARRSDWLNLAGINVEWDFVEAPSQLLEEWAWDPKVLERFALHAETNQPIPAELVAKMRASSEFGKGMDVMRQVYYAALSYHLHARDPAQLDLAKFEKEMVKSYNPYPYVDGTFGYANFPHLDGYSSMYYTYQWSLVLAKDIFTRFGAAGLLDKTVAQAYRAEVLEPGGTKDAAALVEAFLGRASTLDAYKRWLESE